VSPEQLVKTSLDIYNTLLTITFLIHTDPIAVFHQFPPMVIHTNLLLLLTENLRCSNIGLKEFENLEMNQKKIQANPENECIFPPENNNNLLSFLGKKSNYF
jgi:hypothetical protein